MIINAQIDASLLIINYLKNQSGPVSLRNISQATGLPYRFVTKVAFILKKHRLLTAVQGRRGGYQLANNWSKTNLYQLVRLFSPRGFWVKCENPTYHCPHRPVCQHQHFFLNYLTPLMQKTNLKTLLNA